MPGFKRPEPNGHWYTTGRQSSNLAEDRKYYYTYTWDIGDVFGENAFLLQLKDVAAPSFTVNKETYLASSIEYKYAKSITWEDVKLTFYDTDNLLPYIQRWQSSVWDKDFGLKPASSYKKNTSLNIRMADESSSYTWRLYGSWPSTIRHGDLSYTNSEVKVVEVSVSYDWAEVSRGLRIASILP